MKRKLILFLVLLVLVILILSKGIYDVYSPCDYHDGDVSTWESMLPSNDAYALALNSENKPMFKDPGKALSQAITDYKDAISALQKEYDLKDFKRKTVLDYDGAIESDETGESKLASYSDELRQSVSNLSIFIEIYENSYSHL